MKYHVPAAPSDPKSNMVEVTNMPDLLADAAHEDSYIRIVKDPGGKLYTYATDYRKWKGEDVEIPIT